MKNFTLIGLLIITHIANAEISTQYMKKRSPYPALRGSTKSLRAGISRFERKQETNSPTTIVEDDLSFLNYSYFNHSSTVEISEGAESNLHSVFSLYFYPVDREFSLESLNVIKKSLENHLLSYLEDDYYFQQMELSYDFYVNATDQKLFSLSSSELGSLCNDDFTLTKEQGSIVKVTFDVNYLVQLANEVDDSYAQTFMNKAIKFWSMNVFGFTSTSMKERLTILFELQMSKVQEVSNINLISSSFPSLCTPQNKQLISNSLVLVDSLMMVFANVISTAVLLTVTLFLLIFILFRRRQTKTRKLNKNCTIARSSTDTSSSDGEDDSNSSDSSSDEEVERNDERQGGIIPCINPVYQRRNKKPIRRKKKKNYQKIELKILPTIEEVSICDDYSNCTPLVKEGRILDMSSPIITQPQCIISPKSSEPGFQEFLVIAPKGRIDLIIDSHVAAASVPACCHVCKVKKSSPLYTFVKVGDYIAKIDGIDVSTWNAVAISMLLSSRANNTQRVLTLYRGDVDYNSLIKVSTDLTLHDQPLNEFENALVPYSPSSQSCSSKGSDTSSDVIIDAVD